MPQSSDYSLVENGLKLAIKREQLGKVQINCPQCTSPQMQLVSLMHERWKCRECKHITAATLMVKG